MKIFFCRVAGTCGLSQQAYARQDHYEDCLTQTAKCNAESAYVHYLYLFVLTF
jgi:hypothetical protein